MGKKWNKLVENKTITFLGALGGLSVPILSLVVWLAGRWEEGWRAVESWFPWLVGCLVVYTVFWLMLVVNIMWKKLHRYLRDRQNSKRLRRLRPLMEDCKSIDDQATKDLLRNHLARQLIDIGVASPPISGKAAQIAWDLLLSGLLLGVDSEKTLPIRDARKKGLQCTGFWLEMTKP